MSLLLAPHNDDETLFAAYLAQLYKPQVVVCLRSHVQYQRYGITADAREYETACAMDELGLSPAVQLETLDSRPDWQVVTNELRRLDQGVGTVLAPTIEDGGHDHHNAVGEIALALFGSRVVFYSTYTRHGGRSRIGTEVRPRPEWVERKHRALSCYRSQIAEPSCAPWFVGDLAEYAVDSPA